MQAKPRRRWFRFTLRTLFVLVTILCVWLGWEKWIVMERQAILSELRQLSPHGTFFCMETVESDPTSYSVYPNLEATLPKLSWIRVSRLRRLLGDGSYQLIAIEGPVDQKLIERMENAFPESELVVWKHDGYRARRDSLYRPESYRKRYKNIGTLFKTGLPAKK